MSARFDLYLEFPVILTNMLEEGSPLTGIPIKN
jgi:hypothetical protein